jgi:hypothetical protein
MTHCKLSLLLVAVLIAPLAQVRHDIDSSVDFAVFAGDKLFGLKGGI